MSAQHSRSWRSFFGIAAGYNLLIGLGAFLDASWGTAEAINGVLIFCFGIIYALVARDPARFAPTLIAGIVGKAMVVAMLGPPNWVASGDAAIGLIVAGDLLFALGFAIFLWKQRSLA